MKSRLLTALIVFEALAFAHSSAVRAQTGSGADAKFETGPGLPGQKCANGTAPDNETRIFGAGLCWAAYSYRPSSPTPTTPVVVFIHGDGGGRTAESYVTRVGGDLSKKLQVIAISLLRPGYSDGKVKSDGVARAEDDDYRRPTVDSLAGVVDSLRAFYPGRKIVLTGHSGGAALSALVMGIYPGKADGAVLVGCPCDVPSWRDWRNSSAGKSGAWSSLSPLKNTDNVSKSAPIIAVTGDRDENTLPKFALAFVEALKKNGHENTEFMSAPGATHGRSIDSPVYHQAVAKVVELIGGTKAATAQ